MNNNLVGPHVIPDHGPPSLYANLYRNFDHDYVQFADQKIGEGAFGEVFRCRRRTKTVADAGRQEEQEEVPLCVKITALAGEKRPSFSYLPEKDQLKQ